MQWNKKQDELAGQKMEVKSQQNLKIEGRLLEQLDVLKKCGGPFTSCQEIDDYLHNEHISDKDKKKKNENGGSVQQR